MAKITCPHCKAVNQDVALDDACWQCGKPLGAAPSESAAEQSAGEAPGGITATALQTQRAKPEAKVPIEQRYAPVGPNYPVIVISLLVLAAIIVAILFALKIIHV